VGLLRRHRPGLIMLLLLASRGESGRAFIILSFLRLRHLDDLAQREWYGRPRVVPMLTFTSYHTATKNWHRKPVPRTTCGTEKQHYGDPLGPYGRPMRKVLWWS
jgi:hypothetical protein